MKLIDIHNHIQDPSFKTDLLAALARAQRAGVNMMVCNGTCESDWKTVAELGRNYPPIIPCFGLHPWNSKEHTKNWIKKLEKYLTENPNSAMGEIGLDNWIEGADPDEQEKVLLEQLELAKKVNRPIMIHCVQAWGKMLEILKLQAPLPPMLLHAYSGSAEMVNELAGLGAYFSFAGSALRKKHIRTQETLKLIPVERLLIETDCPDIMPPNEYIIHESEGKDGKPRNEPANLKGILTGVAQIRGEQEDVLAQAIWANAQRFLGPLLSV
jgi:TatD DNase family protein